MTDLLGLLEDHSAPIALVGATDDPRKYGSVIYRDLKRKGYRVYPVNPNRSTVDGDPAYPDLASLPEPPALINVVVPPEAGLEVMREADRLGFRRVWLQPGADSPELVAYIQERGFDYLADACIMVRTRLTRLD